MTKIKPKTGIFVDVQNVFYTTRDVFGRHFDYNKFWAVVAAESEIILANAYAIARDEAKQRQFHHILRGVGFDVKLKPFIQRADGSAKGDWDVGITIDMMESAQNLEKLVLVSGDGDFSMLVDHLRSKQKTVEVFGVPKLTANSLIASADNFVAIGDSLLLP